MHGTATAPRHGGLILAEALRLNGVTRIFQVPGESFLAALDGLATTGAQIVTCRHEGAAAMAAEATGKLTGRPGVAFVTRGPGATNAASGVHVARQDSTPMVLFVGQIPRAHRDREAFQEVDFRAMFAPLAKWAAEIDDTARIPEYVARAFQIAQSGRPGPVVLSLPEDMLSGSAAVPDLAPAAAPIQSVDPAVARDVQRRVLAAERPLIVVGGPHWSADAAAQIARIGEAWRVPVAVSFRRQDRLDNDASCYAGDLGVGANPALATRLAESDLVLALGTRLADVTTGGYALLDPAAPSDIIHVNPSPDLSGAAHRPATTIAARAPDFVAALAALPAERHRGDAMAEARAAYEAWQQPRRTPGALRMEHVVAVLRDRLPPDAIVTNGAGNYAAFLHRYFRWHRHGTQLAPSSGSMGYGLPAAIAASVERPGTPVVCLAGDGCFQMTGNELATAMQAGATPVVLVCDNGRYGTIRMHQERHYPGRVSGTDLANPDFAALARAHGAHAETVERDEEVAAALDRALAAGRLSLLHLRLDPRQLSTGQDLD